MQVDMQWFDVLVEYFFCHYTVIMQQIQIIGKNFCVLVLIINYR